MDTTALTLSLELATSTSIILCCVGIPLAWGLSRLEGPARVALEAVSSLPLVLPPTVLGFYLLSAFGRGSWLGALWEGATGEPLAFSFSGLLLASVLYSFPLAIQPLLTAFSQIDASLLEAAACLGAGPLRRFVTVVLPLSRHGVISAMVLAFAHTLGEFGVVLMVGGNMPGRTRTISIAVYDSVQALDYDAAASTSALLLCLSFITLLVVYGVQAHARARARNA